MKVLFLALILWTTSLFANSQELAPLSHQSEHQLFLRSKKKHQCCRVKGPRGPAGHAGSSGVQGNQGPTGPIGPMGPCCVGPTGASEIPAFGNYIPSQTGPTGPPEPIPTNALLPFTVTVIASANIIDNSDIGFITILESGCYLIEFGAQATVTTTSSSATNFFQIALATVSESTITPIRDTSFTSNSTQAKAGSQIAIAKGSVIIPIEALTSIGIINSIIPGLQASMNLAFLTNLTTGDVDRAAYLVITRVGDIPL